MEDRHVVLLAAAVWAGALASPLLPERWAGVPSLISIGAVCAIAFRWRRPLLLCVCGAALAAVLGARAWSGLDPPSTASRYVGASQLVSDPERFGTATRVRLRLADGDLADGWARGRAAAVLVDRLAGEEVVVEGTRRRLRPGTADRLAAVHVASRIDIDSVRQSGPGPLWYRVANGLRRIVVRGAEGMEGAERTLFTGLVLGDDRGQSPSVEADMSAAGLTHLMAVSGQNVAFAMAAAAPLLRRLALPHRFVAAAGCLGLFATVTRFEPSVLRATAMAGVAQAAVTFGTEATGVRLLGLAVAGVVLVDPFLVHRLGFQLSVAASLGLVVFAGRLRDALPGPEVIRGPLATTLAAQAGVAPLLAARGLPVAAVPCNLLAVAAAGAVMMWGLTGGVVAGLIGGSAAGVLHFPTRAMLWWIRSVARVGAVLPLGRLGPLALAGAAVLAVLAYRHRSRLAACAGLAIILVPGLRAPGNLDASAIADGVVAWRDGSAVVVVLDATDPAAALSGLQRARISQIDLLAVPRSSAAVLPALDAVLDRHDVALLAGPPRLDVDGLVPIAPGDVVEVGRLRVEVGADSGNALGIRVRGPPVGPPPYAVGP